MKFVQLHYFLSQNIGGIKRYCVSPCPKVGGHVLPFNSVSAWLYSLVYIGQQTIQYRLLRMEGSRLVGSVLAGT